MADLLKEDKAIEAPQTSFTDSDLGRYSSQGYSDPNQIGGQQSALNAPPTNEVTQAIPKSSVPSFTDSDLTRYNNPGFSSNPIEPPSGQTTSPFNYQGVQEELRGVSSLLRKTSSSYRAIGGLLNPTGLRDLN